jgi:inorganic triphosphatase YgiF
MGVEFEMKYRATADQLVALAEKFPGPWHSYAMETTYYDTPQRILGNQAVTLRCRLENGEAVCTVKTPEIDGARGEWDCRCADIQAALPELCKLGAPDFLLNLGALEVVCGARFTRRATMIVTEDFSAELALDSGVLLGGGREIPLCEAELELKSGDKDAMIVYAQVLAYRLGLVPERKSKFRRAAELAQHIE